MGRYTLPDGRILIGVHSAKQCDGMTCVMHNPSLHHMRTWAINWRGDRGIFERMCTHGIGHPDPDQFEYWKSIGEGWQGTHGCDGCCVPPGEGDT